MYTAKFLTSEETAQGTRFYVEFTNGENTITEWCIPQDENGFNFWVKGRLESINTAETLKAQLQAGVEISVPKENTQPQPSEDDIAFQTWFENNRALENAEKLQERALKHGLEVDPVLVEQINTLAQTVNSTFRPEYVWRI